jgi:hypothetical protein
MGSTNMTGVRDHLQFPDGAAVSVFTLLMPYRAANAAMPIDKL